VLEQVEADRPREEPDEKRHEAVRSNITTAKAFATQDGRFGRP
jgi:hypothetical protein